MNTYGELESKFRFIILASKRAKQLLQGSKPKIKSKSKNLIRVAQEEVLRGVIDFEIVPVTSEDTPPVEDEIFIGEELGALDMTAKEEKVEKKNVEADPNPTEENPPKATKTKPPSKD